MLSASALIQAMRWYAPHLGEESGDMSELTIDAPAVSKCLEAFIAQMVDDLQRNGVIIGLSGGIDSAVACALAVRALGRNASWG